MFARLAAHWVYGGAMFALVLLALTPLLRPALGEAGFLVLLTLPIYALHQFEEHENDRFLTFINTRVLPDRRGLTQVDCFWINVVGVWVLMAADVWLVEKSGEAGWGLFAAFLILINGLAHVIVTLRLRMANPGLWTGVILFLPFGLWSLFRLWPSATPTQISLSLGIVILGHLAIIAWAARPKEN